MRRCIWHMGSATLLLLILVVGTATAQRETVYMAVLSSFQTMRDPYADPGFGLFVSNDGGRTWEHRGWREYIRTFYAEEGRDGKIWSACGNGVLRSTDNGRKWKITTGWEVTEVLKVKAAETDPSLVFASTAYGVFRTTDAGETWEKKSKGIRHPFSGDICIDRTDPRRVLAATEEGVFLSEDRGDQWVRTGLEGKGVRVLMQDLHDAERFWLGTEEDGVFLSTDSGRGWERRSKGLGPFAVYAIALHPRKKGWIFIGTYKGVFRSTDSGASWEQRTCGLTDLQVHSLLVLSSDSRMLLAGTLNRGLFRSTDGGDSWQHADQDSSQVWGLSARSNWTLQEGSPGRGR
jgi:photosystem II stability/assembly factor-like uncharacterized protein